MIFFNKNIDKIFQLCYLDKTDELMECENEKKSVISVYFTVCDVHVKFAWDQGDAGTPD
jgi:hypothetical protein